MEIITPDEIQYFLESLDKEVNELIELKKSNQSFSFSDSNGNYANYSNENSQISDADQQSQDNIFNIDTIEKNNEKNLDLSEEHSLEDTNDWCEKSLLQLEEAMNHLEQSIESDLLNLKKQQQILDKCKYQLSKIKA